MTILFADLVGFTERSDAADPEDVRRTLVPFHERAQEAIVRFGGTLDKFIGDAAMGVFGAPVEHEDDAERAVRAAFDLLEMSEGAHPIRVAVNTGEAVVSMGTGPQVGEAVAGDVVNTTSRMQSAAPPGGIVIGELTWLAVRDRFETEELEPFTAKGKADPIRLWRVVGERTARGRTRPTAPLVGRRRELELLRETVSRARDERCAQLVTVVAEPGIGKSRLVAELREQLGDEVDLAGGRVRALRRRERARRDADGRSATWSGSAPARTRRRSTTRSAALIERAESAESERVWLRSRLSVLAECRASEDGDRTMPADRGGRRRRRGCWRRRPPTARSSWRSRTSTGPSRRCASRCRRSSTTPTPRWSCCARRGRSCSMPTRGGAAAARTARRSGWLPLSDLETTTLVETLLRAAILTETERDSILRNIGGNPLFAVEFVRMLVDSRVVEADMPMSVQAVIGARLDSVAPELRTMLQDAAVVGARFWPDALVRSATRRAPTCAARSPSCRGGG